LVGFAEDFEVQRQLAMNSEGAALIIHSVNVAGRQLKSNQFEIFLPRLLKAPSNQGHAILDESHPWEKPPLLLDMPLGAALPSCSKPVFCVS